MADREREKKKKRAYLDDFEKDLNGNYQYHWCWRCMRWCCWCG